MLVLFWVVIGVIAAKKNRSILQSGKLFRQLSFYGLFDGEISSRPDRP
jgi:hypothetical protein